MAIFSSVFIYSILRFFGRFPLPRDSASDFVGFFTCFVMTAPLAWLYGIPVENFTSPLSSTIFNFSILLIVSIWRVTLMVRVATVIFGFHPSRAFALIAIPASVEMFLATLISSISIVGIMGGMSLSPADAFLLKATGFVTYASVVVFILGILTAIIGPKGNVTSWYPERPQPKITLSTWLTALTIIALWLVIAITPQQKLATREHFRNLINAARYEEAAEFTKTKSLTDFPTHQALFVGRRSYHHPPTAMDLLVHHNDWPEWLRRELKVEVETWIAGLPSFFDDEGLHQTLYRNYREAPFIQKFADEFTPGINASDHLKKEENDEEEPQP